MEWVLVFVISLAAGMLTVEYQQDKIQKQPFKSAAPGYPVECQPELSDIRINSDKGETI